MDTGVYSGPLGEEEQPSTAEPALPYLDDS